MDIDVKKLMLSHCWWQQHKYHSLPSDINFFLQFFQTLLAIRYKLFSSIFSQLYWRYTKLKMKNSYTYIFSICYWYLWKCTRCWMCWFHILTLGMMCVTYIGYNVLLAVHCTSMTFVRLRLATSSWLESFKFKLTPKLLCIMCIDPHGSDYTCVLARC